jgi:hypothetical protein
MHDTLTTTKIIKLNIVQAGKKKRKKMKPAGGGGGSPAEKRKGKKKKKKRGVRGAVIFLWILMSALLTCPPFFPVRLFSLSAFFPCPPFFPVRLFVVRLFTQTYILQNTLFELL